MRWRPRRRTWRAVGAAAEVRRSHAMRSAHAHAAGRGLLSALVLIVVLVIVAAAVATWWLPRDPDPEARSASPLALDDRALIERGRYLATAGNCIGCHTA